MHLGEPLAVVPGIEAEAINTRRNRSRRAGCCSLAIAVIFQITARWASRLVVTTNRKTALALLDRDGVEQRVVGIVLDQLFQRFGLTRQPRQCR